jgi:hypothetical protein
VTIDEGLDDPHIMRLVYAAHAAWCKELRQQGRKVSSHYESIPAHPRECLRLNVASVLAVLNLETSPDA